MRIIVATVGLVSAFQVGCRTVYVSDPQATLGYSWRGHDKGVRAGLGYDVEAMTDLFGAGASGHVGYESVDRTPVGWAEGHLTFVVVSAIGGAWVDSGGVGLSYGVAAGWNLPTCETPKRNDTGPTGALFGGGEGCTQRRRFVPRAFYLVENAAFERSDRHIVGLELTAGWW